MAAVSELTITTCPPGQELAHQIHSEFGEISEVEEAGGAEGTQVQVRDLFGNVPCAKEVSKSDSAETSQIKNTLKALALANPSVEFRFGSGEKNHLVLARLFQPGRES